MSPQPNFEGVPWTLVPLVHHAAAMIIIIIIYFIIILLIVDSYRKRLIFLKMQLQYIHSIIHNIIYQ